MNNGIGMIIDGMVANSRPSGQLAVSRTTSSSTMVS